MLIFPSYTSLTSPVLWMEEDPILPVCWLSPLCTCKELWSSLPHHLEGAFLSFDVCAKHIWLVSPPSMFLAHEDFHFLGKKKKKANNNLPQEQNRPCSPRVPPQCAGLLWFNIMQQCLSPVDQRGLTEMQACDQSAVAWWSSRFPDIVHPPQAPATDNGSLCQTARGRISSRRWCWMAAIKSCSCSCKHSVETKIWKGICYAECSDLI